MVFSAPRWGECFLLFLLDCYRETSLLGGLEQRF